MIKASELRIGNIIYRQTINIIPANFINKEMVIVGEVSNELFPDDVTNQFASIPLTEGWLVKLGFVKRHDGNGYIGNLFFYIENGIWYAELGGRDESVIVKIEYVHSLQNLYFALTGEELTIK